VLVGREDWFVMKVLHVMLVCTMQRGQKVIKKNSYQKYFDISPQVIIFVLQ